MTPITVASTESPGWLWGSYIFTSRSTGAAGFLDVKEGRGLKLTIHILLVPKLTMRRAVPPLLTRLYGVILN
jgi:hypothetical protein